jgi:hypothetical protein
LRTGGRLLVGIDGIYLNGKFLGALLIVTTVYGEGSLFCYALSLYKLKIEKIGLVNDKTPEFAGV